MNLPCVTGATPFERFNVELCRVTFASPVSPQQQNALNSIALSINAENGKQTGFCLTFSDDGLRMTIRQRPSDFRPSPTKKEFDELLVRLELELPSPAAASQHIPPLDRQVQRAAA
jgi:hypothetical protein